MGQEQPWSFTMTLKLDAKHVGCDKGQLAIDVSIASFSNETWVSAMSILTQSGPSKVQNSIIF